MPELPEVETIRSGLASEIQGKTIVSVSVTGHRSIRRQAPWEFVKLLTGRTPVGVERKGKYLIIDLGDTALVTHLRMSGQLLWIDELAVPLAKHTHVRIAFDSAEELHFIDPRTFGEMWVTGADLPELANLGPDALTDLRGPEHLQARLVGRKSGLKTLLMNQEIVAGIGNIYSDEILFAAGLRQSRTPQSLTKPAMSRLYESIQDILIQAIEARGASLSDEQYRDLYGQAGGAQQLHKVYAREGRPCLVCTTPIVRAKLGGRSSFWCRRCQK